MQKNIKILFVCTANICRSPAAQGAFGDLIKKSAYTKYLEIDSAGVHNYGKHAPDKRMQKVAKQNGIDISKQLARQVQIKDFYYFDYIIAMDEYNFSTLVSICPAIHKNKLHKLLHFLTDSSIEDVPDPYNRGNFDEVFALIYSASEKLFTHIINSAIFKTIYKV